jgi:hypothetical protein
MSLVYYCHIRLNSPYSHDKQVTINVVDCEVTYKRLIGEINAFLSATIRVHTTYTVLHNIKVI